MSLRTRLFASHVVIVVVCLFTITLALTFFLRNNPVLRRLANARLAEAARVAPPAPALDAARETWAAYATDTARLTGVRTVLINPQGRVLADSASATLDQFAPDAFTAEVLALREVRDVRGRQWLFLERNAGRGPVVLFLQLQSRFPVLAFALEGLFRPLAQAGLTALCLSFLLAGLIAGSVAAPLRRLVLAAQGLARGQFDQPLPLNAGPPEVQAVAQAFDDMARQVKQGQQTQRDFVANVSHELKTPLTSIQGFSQAILDGAAESPEALRRSASIIYNEADRMRRLVDGLLDLARLDAGQSALSRGPLDLGALLHSAAEKMALRAAEKRITLRQAIEPLPPMMGDADRLAQVIANLLDNALKHTPEGGTVTLSAAPVASGVEISLTDTGPGIPAKDLSRVFERFYQVDKSRRAAPGAGRGAGLGLAISREIVRAHGGQIRAESVMGLGTKFVVVLPVGLGEAAATVKRSSQDKGRKT